MLRFMAWPSEGALLSRFSRKDGQARVTNFHGEKRIRTPVFWLWSVYPSKPGTIISNSAQANPPKMSAPEVPKIRAEFPPLLPYSTNSVYLQLKKRRGKDELLESLPTRSHQTNDSAYLGPTTPSLPILAVLRFHYEKRYRYRWHFGQSEGLFTTFNTNHYNFRGSYLVLLPSEF